MASRVKRLVAKGLNPEKYRNTESTSVNSIIIEIPNSSINFKWRIIEPTELKKRVSKAYSIK